MRTYAYSCNNMIRIRQHIFQLLRQSEWYVAAQRHYYTMLHSSRFDERLLELTTLPLARGHCSSPILHRNIVYILLSTLETWLPQTDSWVCTLKFKWLKLVDQVLESGWYVTTLNQLNNVSSTHRSNVRINVVYIILSQQIVCPYTYKSWHYQILVLSKVTPPLTIWLDGQGIPDDHFNLLET